MLSAAGLAFGILGMNAAQRARRPVALGLGGVMLNALNLLMWAGASCWPGTRTGTRRAGGPPIGIYTNYRRRFRFSPGGAAVNSQG